MKIREMKPSMRERLLNNAAIEVEKAERNREAWIKSWPDRMLALRIAKGKMGGRPKLPRKMPDTKMCCLCRMEKQASEFRSDVRTATLLDSRCRPCYNARRRKPQRQTENTA